MCGIAGSIGIAPDETKIRNSLWHRGPDEFGYMVFEQCRLFHTRLSIQDIERGQQPLERENCVIVFNGEIYNHIALREKLADENFDTHSDTETLLLLYLRYGEKMLPWLDGMFAFAILDKRRREIFFAVDRAGKKPLYYHKTPGTFFFTSELNTVQNILQPEIDQNAINAYLRSGFFFKSHTPYRNVTRIENGTWMKVSIDTFQMIEKKYFDISEQYNISSKIGEKEAIEAIEWRLKESIYRRLTSSDLEVGVFLSGGIDSSLIVALASQNNEGLKTFTVAFEGGYDESAIAENTAKKFNTYHHTLHISMNLREDVEKILTLYGQPFMDSSAIPSYYVSKAAKEHVTVVLNGDGADELFGGYRRYVPIANGWIQKFRHFGAFTHLLPHPMEKNSYYNYFYRLLNIATKNDLDFYLSATNDIFEDVYDIETNKILEKMKHYIENCHLEGLSKMLCLDFELLLFSDLLVKMDIATMANSLEARSPFLGKSLLEFVPTLPNNFKIRRRTTKYLLRKMAKKYLPENLVNLPKRGFEVPLKRWVENELHESIYDALAPGCYSETFIRRSFIDQLLQKRIDIGAEKRAKILWTLYSLEIWYKNIK